MKQKVFLIILDGWGHEANVDINAIAQASTPYMDSLYENYPNAELITFGEEVGLPEGQMGNSEVGHLNIGAGRIVFQELARINNAITDKSFFENEVLKEAIDVARNENRAIHLLGLLSDGGVHSHINHLKAICDLTKSDSIPTFIHAFLDGRDTSPTGGKAYLQELVDHIDGSSVKLSSVIGRYYAMDRDKRWERVRKAYDLLIHGIGTPSEDIIETVQSFYDNDVTDEFMEPIKLLSLGEGVIKQDDVVIFFNFRTDRPRQLTEVLSQRAIEAHDMKPLRLNYFTMTKYSEDFKNVNVIFEKEELHNTLGEVLANKKLKQLRIAETEKYPHVTFFFSGGQESPFDGEERILVSSPKVATYDLMPEMSAHEVKDKVIHHITENAPEFVCLNFANTDMVGHTGILAAAIQAAEVVDSCLAEIIPKGLELGYDFIIIADHGNSDIMQNADGTPHTAHTTNMVPVIFISKKNQYQVISRGKLADIAPTILHLLGVDIPEEMTGNVLLS